MNRKIIFKDKFGNELLKFSGIKQEFNDVLNTITYILSVNFEFFNAVTPLEAEEWDFTNLKSGLTKIHSNEWKTILFCPLGEQFSMQFDLLENGQIKVRSKLCNLMFTGKLEFEYLMDQSFIPDLVKEIEIALKENA